LKRTLVAVVALVSVLILLPTITYGEGQWVKYSGNPVLGPSSSGWDADYTTAPRVLYEGGEFRMWYNGGRSAGNGIGYATSTDGVSWSKYVGPVLLPGSADAWDSSSVALGSVLWNGTAFMMWYRGRSPITYQTGAIGLATSTDGVSWAKYAGNPVLKATAIDQGYIGNPYVVKTLTYDMWYAGRNATYPYSEILFATSFDGISWVKWPHPVFRPSADPTAWDSGSVYSPSAYWNGTIFWIWYSGLGQSLNPQIGIATSPDGATWTRFPNNPILSPGAQGAWDSSGVEQPDVVFSGYGLMLYYDGLGLNAAGRIGMAQPQQGFAIPEFPSAVPLLEVVACAAVLFRKRNKPN
jgi:predicted GH43/DUF377 family glycosyl hydrolase